MKEHYIFFASKSSVLSPRLASSWKALLLPVSRDLEPEGEPLQQGKGQVTITSLLSCQAKSRGILVCVSATLQTISSGQGKEIARNTIKANNGLINGSNFRRKQCKRQVINLTLLVYEFDPRQSTRDPSIESLTWKSGSGYFPFPSSNWWKCIAWWRNAKLWIFMTLLYLC